MTEPLPRRPAIGWLVPLAAVVGIVGVILPWFKPIGYGHKQHISLHITLQSWNGAFPGVLAAVALVLAAILVVLRLVRGRSKPGKNPIRTAGIWTVVLAIIGAIMVFLSRASALNAKVTVNGNTIKVDQLARLLRAHSYTRGTQIGFWLTGAACALALLVGIALIVLGKKAPAAPATGYGQAGSGAPQSAPPQNQQWGPPAGEQQGGYNAPPAGYQS
jgi:hypothetical protein